MDERTDLRLLALARAGDKDAFGYLITQYQPMAQRLALQLTSNPDIACELVQEAMLQAYLSLDHLRDTTRFRSWFYGIVLNTCRSYLRARKVPASSLDLLMGETEGNASVVSLLAADPQEEIEERELHELMLQAVKQLSTRNRTAMLLFYYGQMSLREVACSLDISVVAVKSRLQQARKEVREYLLQLYPEMSQNIVSTQKGRKMIKVVLVDVVQKEPSSVAILVNESGRRALPVWIGYWEGQAIVSVLQNMVLPGPQAFSFMAHLLQASNSKLEEVHIEALKEDTLYAIVKIRHDTTVQEMEVRPGDALALSMQTNSQLFVVDDVMEKMGIDVVLKDGKLAREELDTIVHHLDKMQPRRIGNELTTNKIGYSGVKHPRNLDASQDMLGWIAAGSHNQNYELGVDHVMKRSDRGSFYVKSKVTQVGSMGGLLQVIAADEYRGKKVRFSGVIKAEAVQAQGRLCIYAYGNSVSGVVGQETIPIKGTHDWQAFEVVLTVPEACVRLGFGAILQGMGQIWFDEVQFTLVDQDFVAASKKSSTAYTHPQNLDFRQGTQGWSIFESGAFGYEYGTDASAKRNASLFLKAIDAKAEGQAYLVQTLVADAYRGRRVRFVGYVRSEKVAAWSGLVMIIMGPGGGLTFNSNVQQKPAYNLHIVGTQDWQRYEVVVDVPDASNRIHFGVGLMGQGQIWLADVAFEIVGEDVAVTI